MKKCLDCGYDFAKLSWEHVLSNSLGAGLKVRDLWCAGCNNRFGHGPEAQFLGSLAYFLNFFKIRNSTGGLPRFFMELERNGEIERIPIRDDVPLVPPDEVRKEIGPSGRINIYFKGADPRTIAEYERRHCNAPGFQAEYGPTRRVNCSMTHDGAWSFALRSESVRTVSRYALNFLGFKRDGAFVATPQFDYIRQFIKTGVSNGPEPCFLFHDTAIIDKYLTVDVPDHKIFLYADSRYKTIGDMIVIMGLLYYHITLSTQYHGGIDWAFVHNFDSRRRKHDEGILPVSLKDFYSEVRRLLSLRELAGMENTWFRNAAQCAIGKLREKGVDIELTN